MMNDHLEFLKEFQELCDKYSVRKIDTPSTSPYFSSRWIDGGVPGMTAVNNYKPVRYAYEVFAWKEDEDEPEED